MKGSHQLLLVGVAVGLVSYFAWEWYLSPEARVERFLRHVAEAAEQKDVTTVLSAFSDDYSDVRGLDRDAIAALLERGLEDVDRLHVTIEAIRTRFEGEAAETAFDLTVVGVRGRERYLLVGQPLQGDRVRAQLRREDGEWKIHSVARAGREQYPPESPPR